MSRLRRDRQAMKWARYSRRNEKTAGDVKESRRHWHHLGWLINRKARAYRFGDDEMWFREAGRVIRMFHP